jgi:hypothetical protein
MYIITKHIPYIMFLGKIRKVGDKKQTECPLYVIDRFFEIDNNVECQMRTLLNDKYVSIGK